MNLDHAAILERYRSGDPLHEIAADFGITIYALFAIIGADL